LTNNQQKAKIYRITVDEKLSDNLFRFLICQLKDPKTRFIDRVDEWTEEKTRIVNSKNYTRTLRVTKSQAPIWESLVEGQVYLSGEFKTVDDPKKPAYFIIDPNKKSFKRIDNLQVIKDGVTTLYSDVLKGSITT
jgi:hypothetical protein